MFLQLPGIILCLFGEMRKLGTERFSNLPKVTQLLGGKAKVSIQVIRPQDMCFYRLRENICQLLEKLPLFADDIVTYIFFKSKRVKFFYKKPVRIDRAVRRPRERQTC